MYKIKRMKKKITSVLMIFAFLSITNLIGCSNNGTISSEDYTVEEKAMTSSYDYILSYNGFPVVAVNDNKPYFRDCDLKCESYESYGEKDKYGRCSAAIACLSKDTLPAEGEERGEIGSIKPSGWHTVKYDCIEDRYLYNRCHLIAWCLGAENANDKNLVTGTRYMNLNMTEHELLVLEYIRKTGNHVLYRATPIFVDDELVCRGILLEGKSIEDDEISFCVFYYNVQPGITIDYKTGDSTLS